MAEGIVKWFTDSNGIGFVEQKETPTADGIVKWFDSVKGHGPIEQETDVESSSPPVLHHLSIDPSNVDAQTQDSTVCFQIGATDSHSGIATVEIRATSPSGLHTTYASSSIPVSGDLHNGIYELMATIEKRSEVGTWEVTEIVLLSKSGNALCIDTHGLQSMGLPRQFAVR